MLLTTLRSYTFFAILSVLILYLGFSLNLYGATDYIRYYDNSYTFMKDSTMFPEFHFKDIFLTFDRWSESLVLGRLVKSRKDGPISSGGFTGRFCSDIPEPPAGVNAEMFEHAYQYKIYLNESLVPEFNQFCTYRSQPGGQAFFLSILDRLIGGKKSFKLALYYHIMAAFSAITIFLIILWFAKELGLITGWLLVISFSLFCYPTLYAKSLWWVLWAFYLPFLLFLYILRKEELLIRKVSNIKFMIVGFSGMIVKIFFNGFEFITTTVLMTLIPLFYYGIKNKWKGRFILIRSLFSISGISAAIVVSVMVLSLQFVIEDKNFGDGLKHIYFCFLKRTQIGITTSSGEMAVEQRVHTSLGSILVYYISRPVVFDFRNLGIKYDIRNKYILPFFMLMSFVIIFIEIKFRKKLFSSKMKALIISYWLAILPPLTWFVLFKQHSIIHKVHDPIVWYMPYMFYGVALCGIFLNKILFILSDSTVYKKLKNSF